MANNAMRADGKPVRITRKADKRKRGWFKVGLATLDDPWDNPTEAYPIAQFRHKGDAYNYAINVRSAQADCVLIF